MYTALSLGKLLLCRTSEGVSLSISTAYFTVAWTLEEMKPSEDKSAEYLFIPSSFSHIVAAAFVDGP